MDDWKVVRASILELRRHDWSALRCGCGQSGAHLTETFTRLLSARSAQEMTGHTLENHLEVQSMLFEVAPHAVPVMLTALGEDLHDSVRGHFLGMLEYLVTGESHQSETDAGRPGLEEECVAAVREGIWALYTEAVSGDAEAAFDILEFVDGDEDRLEYYRQALSRRDGKAGKGQG
ncbi:hypothetical protein [Streptomyces aurantiogriseus]|uniref:Uncharacterized protein n=1 Tax=Streptomyces aurantiogriseus TaxID=66870 RepID=A0A918FJA4_9ACTN|nr:hypothetical protein [Streptomyces aurantiogriseus]GGR42676.1 hypothetical protein GCM10010251_69440 [Streptomyces aurantiogriseus]